MTIEARVRKQCEKCKGQSITQNPLWTEFWDEFRGKWPVPMTEQLAWWAERGYPDEWPPEESDCPDCKDGYIESWLSVERLVAMLSLEELKAAIKAVKA